MMKSALCYLLINEIKNLPEMAISTALEKTNSEIYIGYINESDLSKLPQSERLHFVDLTKSAIELNLEVDSFNYINFDNDYFFRLVQLKWALFRILIKSLDVDFIVYLDLDVIVLKDFSEEFTKVLHSNAATLALVQDFTSSPSIPRLCMGIFAFRSAPSTLELIEFCASAHAQALTEASRIGDDDIITTAYNSGHFSHHITRLPQQSFPVGNLANLFLPIALLPGLRPDSPYIFHANFVVGNLRKTLLLRFFLRSTPNVKNLDLISSYVQVAINLIHRKFLRLFRIKGSGSH